MPLPTAEVAEEPCFDKDTDSDWTLLKTSEKDSQIQEATDRSFTGVEEELSRTFSQDEIKLQLLKRPKKGILKNRIDMAPTVTMDGLSLKNTEASSASLPSKKPAALSSGDKSDEEAKKLEASHPEEADVKDESEVPSLHL
jgi:hypothetical protein